MASLETLIGNIVKSRGFIGNVLAVKNPSPKQLASLRTNLAQLDRNVAALAAFFASAPIAVAAPTVVVRAPEPAALAVPEFGFSHRGSAALYGDFASAWFRATFPEAYRDYPPVVHAVTPGAIVTAAAEDGCLAQVCAAGILGTPDGAWADQGDWGLFTGLVSTSAGGQYVHQLWIMGDLVGTLNAGDPDALAWAIDLGFDPN